MATLEQRGKRFRVTFHYLGERHRFSLKTQNSGEAESCRARVEENLRLLERGRLEMPPDAEMGTFLLSDGRLNKPPELAKSLTVRQLSKEYQDAIRIGALEENTRYTISIHFVHLIETFGDDFRLVELSGAALQKHVNRRSECDGRHKRKLSGQTIRKEIATFASAFQWAISSGLVNSTFPKDGLKYPKLTAKVHFRTRAEIEAMTHRGGMSEAQTNDLWESLFLTRQEIDEVLELIRVNAVQPWVYPMAVTAVHTGLRRSELVRLQISDVQFENGTIHVSEKKRARGKSTFRTVPISPLLEGVLKEWLAKYSGGNYLFPPCDSRSRRKSSSISPSVTPPEAHDHLRRALAKTNWSGIRGWHTFRHTFASNCAAAGVPEYLVGGWMGHQTQEMIQRYRHLFPSKQKQAIALVFGS